MVFRYEWDLIECKMWNSRLYFLSKCLFPWFRVLGPFFSASCPNETNTLKLEPLNHQMAFCIWRRVYWIQDGKLNTVGYFLSCFFHKNVSYLIPYQLTKFHCHIFFSSQDIKQNVLLSSYLDNCWRHEP